MPTSDETVARRRSLSTIGFVLSLLAVLALMAGLMLRVRDTEAGGRLAGRIADGSRPAAPALPTVGVDGAAVHGVPALGGATLAASGAPAGTKAVVVNFWASWCGPCRDEAPMLDDASRRFADNGVLIVGVNPGGEDTERDARAFVRAYKLSYPMVRGTRAQVAAWGVHNFPETFVVGRDGHITARVAGPVDAETVEAMIDAELADH
jgi:cytochrome c biogenesis protein CcmG/thiol:disulfide interchange protein DsbE